ncbi:3728_t:CDS:2 [Paraglomus occultum]|uniref:3728_t:CDS:1 n=1 Tax=Paraglomus occultum TaxID=144539 RepID=A0A9N8WFS9_9GLOM|nr:3728_t:CDS:2 [Paraglomus occultum]
MKSLVLNPPERAIRYKLVIRAIAIIVCLAFWNIVDYNIHALEEASLQRIYEEDPPNYYYFDEPVQEMFIDEEITDTEELINLKYCGSSKCRFLFPVLLREQESRARIHMIRIMLMARKTNRVLVLPNVGGSRLGACKLFSFDYYYSIDTKKFPDFKFITQSQFLSWNQEMREINAKMPTAKAVYLDSSYKIKKEQIKSEKLNLEKYKIDNCMQPFYLDYEDKARTILIRKTFNDRDAIARFVIDGLRSVQSDVLLMNYSFPRFNYPNLQREMPPLNYANYLIEQAKNAASSIRPYVGIHWRMESAKAKNLVNCSVSLVEYIKRVKQEHKIKNVYIATDYPLDGGDNSHSDTFATLTENHHKAANILNNSLDFYTWMRLDSSPSAFAGSSKRWDHEDSGILGTLDKLMLVYADWFVSGPGGCARVQSSYTAQVVKERKRHVTTIGQSTDNLLNIKDIW